MDVNALRQVDAGQAYSIGSSSAAPTDTAQPQQKENKTQPASGETKQVDRGELDAMTEELNKFMQLLNADLHFVLHEKTQTLMVRVVDSKDHKILKEFPPHEFLDTIAKIREYVGVLIDKKI